MKKRQLQGIVVGSLFLLLMTGCGKGKIGENLPNVEGEKIQNQQEQTDSLIEDSNVESSKEEKQEETRTLEDTTQEKDRYQAFLQGQEKAYVTKDFDFLKEKESLTLQEMVDQFAKDFYYKEDVCIMTSYRYAWMDCGADGVKELVVEASIYEQTNEMDKVQEYFILKDREERLDLISVQQTYYRSETWMNDYGYIISGGSSGAAIHNADYRYLNGEGQEIFLYSVESIGGLAEPWIPYSSIPQSKRPTDYPMANYDEEGKDINIYNFTQYEEYDDNWDENEKYEQYCENNFYVFYDRMGEDAVPSSEYAALYQQLGLEYYTLEEAQKKISAREQDMGLTETIKQGGELQWQEL